MSDKKCFFCGEKIDSKTNVCPHCGESQDVRCPQCCRPVSENAKSCPYCNAELTPKPVEEFEPWGTAAYIMMFFYCAVCICICNDVLFPTENALANSTIEEKLRNIRDSFICFLFPLVTSIIACYKKQGISKAVISLVISLFFGFITFLILVGS